MSELRQARFSIALGLAALTGLGGCGGGGKEKGASLPRVKASGKVEFDGNPVPAGTVSFLNSQTGNISVCKISHGRYSSSSGEGPNPGENTVTIVGKESDDGTPLWAGAWSKKVQVEQSGFQEDFSISSSEVKPFDPKSIQIDE
jgi:hypothetical protein